tara:strand:+ start:21838 stop:23400 length:1563 start_codon:yes stop_codon:yes gene_type:complete
MKRIKLLITIIINKITEIVTYPFIVKILSYFSSYNQSNASKSVLLEGFWHNYNHFFRLNVFLRGLFLKSNYKLIAILYKKDNSFRLFKLMGVKKFYFLEDLPIQKKDIEQAKNLLKKIKSHSEIFNLVLPYNIPIDIIYDTVSKDCRHPQPDLNDKKWVEKLSDVFRLIRFYKKIFNENKIEHLILSHPYKNEYGVALWLAIKEKIKCYHLTGNYEVMRVKKFNKSEDFYQPFEALNYKKYLSLSKLKKDELLKKSLNFFEFKKTSSNTDINHQLAYNIQNNSSILKKFNIPKSRKVILVACHSWYDFSHAFGMRNFTDFYDWIYEIINIIPEIKDVSWIFKTHPTENWYDGFKLNQLKLIIPKNVIILNNEYSIDQVLNITNCVITYHGTIALEATSRGLPVLCADKSYYSDWNFCYVASSRKLFIDKIKAIKKLRKPNIYQINKSKIFAYLSLGPNSNDLNEDEFTLPADHLSKFILIQRMLTFIIFKNSILTKQYKLINRWINSDSENLSIFQRTGL